MKLSTVFRWRTQPHTCATQTRAHWAAARDLDAEPIHGVRRLLLAQFEPVQFEVAIQAESWPTAMFTDVQPGFPSELAMLNLKDRLIGCHCEARGENASHAGSRRGR